MRDIEDLIIMIMIGLSCFLFGILMYLIGWSSYYSIVGGMLMLVFAIIFVDLTCMPRSPYPELVS